MTIIIREEVYEAIDRERDYQDAKWGNPRIEELWTGDNHKEGPGARTIDEFSGYIFNRAGKLINVGANEIDELHEIRKIAALCVACMEQHGVVERDPDD